MAAARRLPPLEERCLAYLEELRWPGGVECPRCGAPRARWLHTRGKWACASCRYQFRVTAGTVMHNGHLPFATWLAAVDLIAGSADGCPATRLHELLGGSYKSLWFAGHRIRRALAEGAHEPCPTCSPAHARLWADVRAAAGTAAPPAGRYAAGAYHHTGAAYRRLYEAERRWRADAPPPCAAARALLACAPLALRQLVSG
jgi:transposase-like protein